MRTACSPTTTDEEDPPEAPQLQTNIRALLHHDRPAAANEPGISTEAERTTPPPEDRGRKWQVLEQFAHQGFVYQLRRKTVQASSAKRRLTPREEQVLVRVVEGESNKSIAYSLGLSPSTVGVLLFRAASKLGAKSRNDLLSAYMKSRP